MESVNKEIIRQLTEYANIMFESIKQEMPAGTYTAAQIDKMLISEPEKYGLKTVRRTYNDKYSSRIAKERKPFVKTVESSYGSDTITTETYNYGECLTVEAGTFKATFDACKLFDYLNRFERLENVRNKAHFVKQESKQGDLIFSGDINADKAIRKAVKYLSKDELRPALQTALLDIEKSAIVVTDGYKLAVYPVQIETAHKTEAEAERKILLTADALKNFNGVLHVEAYTDGNAVTTYTTRTDGKEHKTSTDMSYPNWERVLPQLKSDGYIKIETECVQTVMKAIKAAKDKLISFQTEKGNDYVSIEFKEKYDALDGAKKILRLKLENAAKFTAKFYIDADKLQAVSDWDGGIWYNGTRPVVFDDKNTDISLVMPFLYDDSNYSEPDGETVQPLGRRTYLEAEMETAKAEAAMTQIKALTAFFETLGDILIETEIKRLETRLKQLCTMRDRKAVQTQDGRNTETMAENAETVPCTDSNMEAATVEIAPQRPGSIKDTQGTITDYRTPTGKKRIWLLTATTAPNVRCIRNTAAMGRKGNTAALGNRGRTISQGNREETTINGKMHIRGPTERLTERLQIHSDKRQINKPICKRTI